MVNPVGVSPQQAILQQSNAVAQEVRQRNEQTQPRQAPPADTQRNTLQTRGDDQRRQQFVASKRGGGQNSGSASSENPRRGQLLDIEA